MPPFDALRSDGRDPFQHALTRAVAEGRCAFERAESDAGRIRDALDDLVAAIDAIDRDDAGGAARDLGVLRGALSDQVASRGRELGKALERRRTTLGRFRIALFGRTHTGKSTFVAALIRGDGDAISRGTTGFTNEAITRRWGALDVEDTPGIEAFGDEGRLHEERARAAVLASDLVLLAFDDSNQKQTELAKIAEWVAAYDKPCIVLINVKNAGWRRPDKLPRAAQRLQPQLSVVQTADYLRRRLQAAGFGSPPIVAVHAQNALFARASEPYRHELTEGLRRGLLDKLGVEGLLRQSNHHRFEALVRALVERGGASLRVGALQGEVRGSARKSLIALETERKRLRELGDVLEPQARAALRLVGRDPVPARLLERLDAMADAPAPQGTSDMDRQFRDLIAANVGRLRRTALERARAAVAGDRKMSRNELRDHLFPEHEVTACCEAVSRGLEAHVRRRIADAKAEVSSDLDALLEAMGAGLTGAGGRGELVGAVALGAAAIVAGIAGIFVVPEALIVGGLMVAASFLFGWLRKKLFRSSERDRMEARRKNLQRAEDFVENACESIESRLRKGLEEACEHVAKGFAIPLLRRFVAVKTAELAVATACTRIATLAERRDTTIDLQSIMERAVTQVCAGAPDGQDPRSWTLLGGDWLAEKVGDSEPAAPIADPRLSRLPRLPPATTQDLAGLEALIASLHGEDRAILDRDVEEARAWATTSERTFAVIGEFSSGKTSFVRRLFVTEGLPLPDDMNVEAGPTTSEVRAHALGENVRVLDTPGLQAGEEAHEAAAFLAGACSPMVVFTINPHLLVADAGMTRAILAGSGDLGCAPARPRALLGLQRADSLGACPVDEPAAWRRILQAKREEAARMLGAWNVDAEPLHFVAADPFQRAGARTDVTPADYAGTESWDGVAELRDALEASLRRQSRGDLVEAGVHRLAIGMATRRRELLVEVRRHDQSEALDRQLAAIFDGAARRYRDLGEAVPERVRAVLSEHAQQARQSISTAGDAAALAKAIEDAERWPESARGDLARLGKDCCAAANDIADDVAVRANRRLDSPLGRMLSEHAARRKLGVSSPRDAGALNGAGRAVGAASRACGAAAAKLEADPQVLRGEIEAALGGIEKLKPWEATKLGETLGAWAPRIAKIGKALAWLGPVLEAGSLANDLLGRRRLQKARKAAAEKLDAVVEELVQRLVGGEGDDGLLPSIEARALEIESLRAARMASAEASRRVSAGLKERAERLAGSLRGAGIDVEDRT